MESKTEHHSDPRLENKSPIELIRELDEEIKSLKKEVQHWRANHDNRVVAARALIERPDMPWERVQAYEQYLQLQARNEVLEKRLMERNLHADH